MPSDFADALYTIAATMACVDGHPRAEELATAIDLGQRFLENFDETRLLEICQRCVETVPSPSLARGFGRVLEPQHKGQLFSYLVAIAQADGSVSHEEEAELDAIAEELRLDLAAWMAKHGNARANTAGATSDATDSPNSAPQCPACGAQRAVPLIYGTKTDEHKELCAAGKAASGGSMRRLLSGEAPHWYCAGCEHYWRGGLFAGGAGTSQSDAVVIQGVDRTAVGVRAEKQWLTEQLGLDRSIAGDPSGWDMANQSLVSSGDKQYDVLAIALPDGSERHVYFDVTCFFGK